MDPYDLLASHCYQEAFDAYDSAIKNSTEIDPFQLAGRFTALLCLGRYCDALHDIQMANELNRNEGYLEDIGVVHWLMGQRQEAIRTWKKAAEGIINETIRYADLAGGVSQGLLLWYGGITTSNEEVIQFSLKYLATLAKRPKIKNWPGPLALLALGRTPFDEITRSHFGSSDLLQLLDQARGDLLKRRETVQALFYLATSLRKDGKEENCKVLMSHIAHLENPLIEREWYLAAGEAGILRSTTEPEQGTA